MTIARVLRGHRVRTRRHRMLLVGAVGAIALVFTTSLMVGNTLYSLDEVIRVLLGQSVPGASFTVAELRLPRASLAVCAGLALGAAGVTFQTMLRNPLASPDVIGISSGASVAAVIGIVVLSLPETVVSLLALVAALATAGLISLLAHRGSFAGTRLVLIGIGLAAMLDSVTAYVLSRASDWDIQAAMQWLTGSLNGATWDRVVPLAVVCVLVLPALMVQHRSLAALRLGDDTAAALGVAVRRTRTLVIVCAVVLLAFAIAAAGPIAFVALMSGPIAARIWGAERSLVLAAGLVGALLVLVADLIGQLALPNRYPVGVITGLLGAPFLLYLLVRTHRSGGSL